MKKLAIALVTMLFVGVGGFGLLANAICSATAHVHMARKGETVTRTEYADYTYDGADNTASIRTEDGNVWLISNPKIDYDCTAVVGFDDRGTRTVRDDRVVSIDPNL